MDIQILTEELAPTAAGLITESSSDGKHTWLQGIFMESDVKNRNGRVYPLAEMTKAVKMANSMISETNGIFGELDHPQTLTINLDRISHVITELAMDGSAVVGKAKLLNTPMGNIAIELVNSGVIMGVSSRGAGTVNEGGIVSDFQFTTVDIVANPSAPGATPTAIVESLEQATNGKAIMSLAESMVHDETAQKYFAAEVKKWLETGLFLKR